MFRISERLDYGIHPMIALASDNDHNLQPTASLARELSTPLPFLHQISHALQQAGLIKAIPRPGGGIRLNQPASSITARQIVETLEGTFALIPENENNHPSFTKNLWNRMEYQIIDYLDQQRLDRLAKANMVVEL